MSSPFREIDGKKYVDYDWIIMKRNAQEEIAKKKLSPVATLQAIYDSEINIGMSWNWDGGIEVRLGNGLYNHEKNWVEKDNVKTVEEAIKWFEAKAIEVYPDSTFAKLRSLL